MWLIAEIGSRRVVAFAHRQPAGLDADQNGVESRRFDPTDRAVLEEPMLKSGEERSPHFSRSILSPPSMVMSACSFLSPSFFNSNQRTEPSPIAARNLPVFGSPIFGSFLGS